MSVKIFDNMDRNGMFTQRLYIYIISGSIVNVC